MRKLLTAAATVVTLVPFVAALIVPASAQRAPVPRVLTLKQAASVYPGLEGGDRFKGRYGIVAPRFVVKRGKLKCDRYRNFKGVNRANVYFFNVERPRSMTLDQAVTRFRTVQKAKRVMRYYRQYIRKCRGTHPTTDGEGGKARMKVRGWPTPRIGGGSVGILNAFIQYGDPTWRRTVIARTGRTISVQEETPFAGKGTPKRVIKISRKAIAKLS